MEGLYPPDTDTLFSTNASNENFEKASLFEIVQRWDNKSFIVNITPLPRQSQRKGFNLYRRGI